jgi:hypothetical protein
MALLHILSMTNATPAAIAAIATMARRKCTEKRSHELHHSPAPSFKKTKMP